MKKLLALLMLWPTLVFAQANSQNPSVAASMLYTVDSATTPYPPQPWAANISGELVRFRWKDLEPTQPANPTDPTDPAYQWTTPIRTGYSFDQFFTTLPAGKSIALDVSTGSDTPDWLLDLLEADTGPAAGLNASCGGGPGTCHGTFYQTWTAGSGAGKTQNTTNFPTHNLTTCAIFETPIPWDTTYQTQLGYFLKALATHVSGLTNGSKLVRLYMNAVTSDTGEEIIWQVINKNTGAITCDTSTPYANNPFCPYTGGVTPKSTCTPYNTNVFHYSGALATGAGPSTAQWQYDGYTPQLAETAWKALLAKYAAAFPGIVVGGAYSAGSAPPLNSMSQDTGNASDLGLQYQFQIDECQNIPYPSVQTNTAQPPSIATAWLTQSSSGPQYCLHGTQDKTSNTGWGFDAQVNAALQNNIQYMELYGGDSAEPQWAALHQMYQNSVQNIGPGHE